MASFSLGPDSLYKCCRYLANAADGLRHLSCERINSIVAAIGEISSPCLMPACDDADESFEADAVLERFQLAVDRHHQAANARLPPCSFDGGDSVKSDLDSCCAAENASLDSCCAVDEHLVSAHVLHPCLQRCIQRFAAPTSEHPQIKPPYMCLCKRPIMPVTY